MRFSLYPESVAALCQLVLAAAITAYLYGVRGKSRATWWLAAAMTGHTIFLAALFLLLGEPPAWGPVIGIVQRIAFLSGLTAGLGFAYHFLENPYPTEWKWAVGISGAITLGWLILLGFNLASAAGPEPEWAGPLTAASIMLITVWTFVVHMRKTMHLSEAPAASALSKIVNPSGRRARAHRAFGFLSFLLSAIVLLIGLASTGVVAGELLNTSILIGFLVYVFAVVVIYVNNAPEPTTFQVKVVAFVLATVVAVLGVTTLVAYDAPSLARASGVEVPPAGLRFEPLAGGGYRILEADARLLPAGGMNLEIENGGSVPVAIGFDFPFAGSTWDSLYVDDDGLVSFGGGFAALAEFETTDMPIIAPFFAALDPEIGGDVFVDRTPEVFSVTWNDLPHYQASQTVTAQIALDSTGTIAFRYGRISPAAVRAERGVYPRGGGGEHIEVEPDGLLPATVPAGAALAQSYKAVYRAYVTRRLSGMVWIVLGSTLFVLLVVPVLLQSSVTRPLMRLLEGVRRVDEGDLDAKVPVTVRDELGNLAHHFNRMTASLQAAEEQLRAHAQELEVRVEERTAALKKSLEDLRAAQTQLVQQEKLASLGALTAGIAHEIKNPLNFINNFAMLSVELADELEEELDALRPRIDGEIEELEDIVYNVKLNSEKIAEHGRRADAIVRSMLQHSRGRTGERRDVDVNQLLDEYVNLAFHGMRAQDARFNCRIERDLDPAVGLLHAVPQDLGRVFINLLNNAFYAVHEKAMTAADDYEPAVTVRTRRQDREVVIEISDNGPGIPDALRTKIFEPFFTTKPAGSGTGLGLSLSHDIIAQEHGGRMEVETIPGCETTFVIRLPAHASGGDTSTFESDTP